MDPPRLKFSLLPDLLAVCRLERGQQIPAWATGGDFYSVSRIREELSIICASSSVPENVRASRGWRAIKIEWTFDLDCAPTTASSHISRYGAARTDNRKL